MTGKNLCKLKRIYIIITIEIYKTVKFAIRIFTILKTVPKYTLFLIK